MFARPSVLSFGVAAVGLIVSANAFAQNDLKSQIAGAYSLVSTYDQLADGKKNDPWGQGVEGSVIYTPSGIFSLQIMAANRHSSSAQGPLEPVGPIVTYYGTYTVDDASKTITYHIQRSSFPSWNGIDRKVTIESVTGSDLDVSVLVKGDPKFGDHVAHAKWKREGAS
jgi:Lipocalin-like domain